MADPAGATNYITIVSNPASLAASMPDVGNTFAADLVIDQALAINYEGGAETFIDWLLAGCTDLRVYNADASIEVPFGIKQFSQVAGSRKLILGLGIPSTAPLLSSAPVTYRLYRGCTGGSFEARSSVVPVADGWAGYWPLEEAAGTFYDWTANANHGTDLVSATGKTGQIGSGQQFDGTDDRIHLTTTPITGTGAFTLSAWINTTSTTGRQNIITFGSAAVGQYLSMYLNNGALTCDWWGSPAAIAAAAVNDGNWHLAQAIYDGASVQCAVDGARSGNVVTFASNITAGINHDFSSSQQFGGQFWAGYMDEIQIANVAQSDNWITSYYNMTSANGTFWTVGAEQACGGLVLPRRNRTIIRSGPTLRGVI